MMKFSKTPIDGAWVVDMQPIHDDRGFFARAWDADEFADHGIDPTIAQLNLSHSERAGTFRGFHWQEPPDAETKVIRCVAGSVFNVIVDMRPGSSTLHRWFGVELTEENLRILCVPEGVANGFLITSDGTRMLYQVSRPYRAGATERGVRFDDPTISVQWPRAISFVSDKDRSWPDVAPAGGNDLPT